VIAFLNEEVHDSVWHSHEQPNISSCGLSEAHNGELAKRLAKAARKRNFPGQLLGVPYGTNGSAYSPLAVPTVVFGPGSIAQAHTADEWVEIAQLHAAVEILVEFVASYSA
jgi:acetylornithine deacetylase